MITKLLGVRIKELRAETGLSQESFANKIDMARTYFAEVETGKRNISMRNLVKIANGLNVTLKQFFDSELFDPIYLRYDEADSASPAESVQLQQSDEPSRADYTVIPLPEEPSFGDEE